MSTHAEVVADSIAPSGARLTTFVLQYPRFIHAEFLTHRMFSRNASSSRAIPVARQARMLRRAMAIPVHVGAAQPGMQAAHELRGWRRRAALALWQGAGLGARATALALARLGVHKQVANRIMEPWAHIQVVCTATDYEGFFALRCHAMAQPEIRVLADAMRQARERSSPRPVPWGAWHLPLIHDHERAQEAPLELAKMSAARCARVSYCNHDGSRPDRARDLALYHRLITAVPAHASPTEHQALADPEVAADRYVANLRGWRPFRHLPREQAVA